MAQDDGCDLDEEVDVLVAGAGLAGLTTANYLARAGLSVHVCEAASTAGGRARTEAVQGFHCNMGPHALYRRGLGVKVLDELGVAYSGSGPPATGWLSRRTDVWPLPGAPLALLTSRLLGPREKARALRFFIALNRIDTDALQGLSLDDWLAGRKIDGNLASLIRALVRLTSYCDDSASLPAGLALSQLQLGAGGVLYLDGGWRTLVSGLVANAAQQGARVHCGTAVRSVAAHAERILRVTLGDGREVRPRAVVLAVAPRAALAILGGAASQRLQRFVDRAEPVRQACLDLGLNTLPNPDRTFAMALDEPFYCSLHSVSMHLAPPGGHLFQLGRYGGEPDERTRERLEQWMDGLQPGWRDHVLTARYLRSATVMNAMPSVATGGTAGRPACGDAGPPGVFLCGDWVGAQGILSDASFASGCDAARQVAKQLKSQLEKRLERTAA